MAIQSCLHAFSGAEGGPARAGNGGPLRAEPASRGGLFLGLAHQSYTTGHPMKPRVTLSKALEDPELLGSALAGPTWHAWRSLLIAAMGEPLTNGRARDLHPVYRQGEAPDIMSPARKPSQTSIEICYRSSIPVPSIS